MNVTMRSHGLSDMTCCETGSVTARDPEAACLEGLMIQIKQKKHYKLIMLLKTYKQAKMIKKASPQPDNKKTKQFNSPN